MAVSSGHVLARDLVTGLLNGTTIGTWEEVQALVQTLDGEYTYFEPLWQQAAEHTTPAPQPPGQGTTSRIEELITTFSNILATTSRPTTPRRPLPTPIQAATTWPGR
ncbi:hypothetical protein [Streptomyces sp. sk2.1]|uniref:hypothetical protein n=1 Tax=Streptomyces sp. sk2.1 TaxID=2478959 RepID=UPI00141D4025|nr:hypothetical protein [Streptomyces sp. sk2.1]TXS59466.1 hypothetical protein EAO76_42530 [Streptomyces sp. sk2.1]